MSNSVVDSAVHQQLVTSAAAEVAAMSASRTRGWDELSKVVLTSQVNFLNSPTELVVQAIRGLNGTPTMPPGNAPNANQ